MNDFKVNIEHLLLSYYIKYDKLDELCKYTSLINPSINSVIVYIDLYDMLKPIYTRDVKFNKKLVIVSSIINLAAHIRAYFYKRYNLPTIINLVYAEDNTLNHKQFCQSFGNDDYKKSINYHSTNTTIVSQIELVKILCAYLNGIYLVKRQSNFSMFVYDNLLNHKNKNIAKLIITKSVYAYQIPALIPDAVIFRPKKSNGEDISFPITYYSCFRSYFNKITSSNTQELFKSFNPGLLSLLITITGMPSYNLKSILNIRTAARILYNAIINNEILNGYNSDINFVYDSMTEISKYIDKASFIYRFKAVDLIFQHMLYISSIESKDITWNLDLNDPKTVLEINDKYFNGPDRIPLDLNSL